MLKKASPCREKMNERKKAKEGKKNNNSPKSETKHQRKREGSMENADNGTEPNTPAKKITGKRDQKTKVDAERRLKRASPAKDFPPQDTGSQVSNPPANSAAPAASAALALPGAPTGDQPPPAGPSQGGEKNAEPSAMEVDDDKMSGQQAIDNTNNISGRITELVSSGRLVGLAYPSLDFLSFLDAAEEALPEPVFQGKKVTLTSAHMCQLIMAVVVPINSVTLSLVEAGTLGQALGLINCGPPHRQAFTLAIPVSTDVTHTQVPSVITPDVPVALGFTASNGCNFTLVCMSKLQPDALNAAIGNLEKTLGAKLVRIEDSRQNLARFTIVFSDQHNSTSVLFRTASAGGLGPFELSHSCCWTPSQSLFVESLEFRPSSQHGNAVAQANSFIRGLAAHAVKKKLIVASAPQIQEIADTAAGVVAYGSFFKNNTRWTCLTFCSQKSRAAATQILDWYQHVKINVGSKPVSLCASHRTTHPSQTKDAKKK